jgi:hypothetical protein
VASWINYIEVSADLKDPGLIAEKITDDLEAALEQFTVIATALRVEDSR